ncbi:hypothetical protein B0H11DRAFT_1920959 [Mycena galericulata]|nr:hypothetical protein B0H11DRAFT_1920959 [Mycena galericulata]
MTRQSSGPATSAALCFPSIEKELRPNKKLVSKDEMEMETINAPVEPGGSKESPTEFSKVSREDDLRTAKEASRGGLCVEQEATGDRREQLRKYLVLHVSRGCSSPTGDRESSSKASTAAADLQLGEEAAGLTLYLPPIDILLANRAPTPLPPPTAGNSHGYKILSIRPSRRVSHSSDVSLPNGASNICLKFSQISESHKSPTANPEWAVLKLSAANTWAMTEPEGHCVGDTWVLHSNF